MPLLFAAYLLYAYYLRRTYAHAAQADEQYVAQTADGFNLAVFRYVPRWRARDTSPVLLVHGLGANRRNFDVGEECSLARFLAGHGFDCWLVDLRGCGESAVASRRWAWTFDDHAEYDIPAVLSLIERSTGRGKVHWIGHSMGGMLLYAYLLRKGETSVQSGITLGSPVRFAPRDDHFHRVVLLESFLRWIPQLPVGNVARLATPLLGVVTPAFVHRQMNVQNVDWAVLRKAYYNTSSHLAPRVVTQFLAWMKRDDFFAADGGSYRERLGEIQTPLFVIAGRGDKLVPPGDVREAYERVASRTKQYLELGCEQGFACDYGHIDLIFGRRAHDEVFPRILDWLLQNAPTETAFPS